MMKTKIVATIIITVLAMLTQGWEQPERKNPEPPEHPSVL